MFRTEITIESVEESPVEIYSSQQHDINRYMVLIVSHQVVEEEKSRDEDPEFFSTDPDPAQLKNLIGSDPIGSDSGSDLKSK